MWSKYTINYNGEKLNQKFLLGFFHELPPPLGFGPREKKKSRIAKEIMGMALTGDGIGNVYFNEVLFAAMKRAFG